MKGLHSIPGLHSSDFVAKASKIKTEVRSIKSSGKNVVFFFLEIVREHRKEFAS